MEGINPELCFRPIRNNWYKWTIYRVEIESAYVESKHIITCGWKASSAQFSLSVMSNSLQPHGLQHARLPSPSPTPRDYLNSCPSSQWCHPTFIPFSFCCLSFPEKGSFPMTQVFAWGGQSTGASSSASVLSMNYQSWFPLGLTGVISLQSKGLSRVFSNNTVQKHQIFDAQPSLWSNSHMCTWLLEKL